jgi:hypothetical protein
LLAALEGKAQTYNLGGLEVSEGLCHFLFLYRPVGQGWKKENRPKLRLSLSVLPNKVETRAVLIVQI